jgi:hypothetical protein
MIPLGDSGKDLAAEVIEDGVEALALLRSLGGKGVDEFAGLHGGQDGIAANIPKVLGNPLHAVMRGVAKVFDVAGPGLRVMGIRNVGIRDMGIRDIGIRDVRIVRHKHSE